jgi:hypothetical protein
MDVQWEYWGWRVEEIHRRFRGVVGGDVLDRLGSFVFLLLLLCDGQIPDRVLRGLRFLSCRRAMTCDVASAAAWRW